MKKINIKVVCNEIMNEVPNNYYKRGKVKYRSHTEFFFFLITIFCITIFIQTFKPIDFQRVNMSNLL